MVSQIFFAGQGKIAEIGHAEAGRPPDKAKNGRETPARSVHWGKVWFMVYKSHFAHHFFAHLGFIEVLVQSMERAVRKAPNVSIRAVL